LELLVKRAQKKDKEAFIELMEIHKKLLYVTAKSRINNDEDIADIIQETIMKCFKNIHKMKDTVTFRAWLMKIHINNCNDFIRSRKSNLELDDASERGYISEEFNEIEVNELIEALNEDLRKVIKLFYLEDNSVKDIAGQLNVAEGTVKSRLHRARKKLIELFSFN
jgi:RNA polymerase sigma-70 factor (ECF subfamily)